MGPSVSPERWQVVSNSAVDPHLSAHVEAELLGAVRNDLRAVESSACCRGSRELLVVRQVGIAVPDEQRHQPQ